MAGALAGGERMLHDRSSAHGRGGGWRRHFRAYAKDRGQSRRPSEVAELVEIIKRDRGWNDNGARKQLLQFFDAWGAVDPATISARRKLSALLFS